MIALAKLRRITILETKGDQFDNLDTAYKRDVLNFRSKNFLTEGAQL
jgi:type III restriction enzyme